MNTENAQHEAESYVACWYVAGPMEAAGLYVEREGNVLTVELGGQVYRVTVTAGEPRSFDPGAAWLRAAAG